MYIPDLPMDVKVWKVTKQNGRRQVNRFFSGPDIVLKMKGIQIFYL